jgi:hypothetical protein
MTTYTFRKGAEQHFRKIEKQENIEVPEETKKFNLRLSNGDLDFIKFLASKEGISRNKLIDDFVESIIQDFLESLKTEEYIMLIKLADRLNHVDTWKNMDKSWISNLYPSRAPYELIDNDLNNQAPMNDLSERSDRYKRMFTTLINSKLVKDFNAQLKGNEANETEE